MNRLCVSELKNAPRKEDILRDVIQENFLEVNVLNMFTERTLTLRRARAVSHTTPYARWVGNLSGYQRMFHPSKQ